MVCFSESKVLSNAPGRDSRSLLKCLQVLSPAQRAEIKFFSVDMHDPFILIIKKFCPNAQICVDRFHLAQKVNDTFDDLRKAEFKLADAANDKFQLKMLDQLKKINKNILNGMILVEYFHHILDKTNLLEFRKALTLWYRLVRESGIKRFKKLAQLIKKNRKYIEAYVTSGLTTAKSEGLNNKIKVLRR